MLRAITESRARTCTRPATCCVSFSILDPWLIGARSLACKSQAFSMLAPEHFPRVSDYMR